MPFSDLLDDINNLDCAAVSINRDVTPLVKTHSAQDAVQFVGAELDTEVSFGHCIKYRDRARPYAHSKWTIQVRYANSLNLCWQRFVCCKELMHAFDPPEAHTNTETKFTELVTDLALESFIEKPAIFAERAAVWKAMAVLAPMQLVSKFDDDYAAGNISDYEIALTLRIPKFYVPHIMSEGFDDIVRMLREHG